VSVTGRAVLTSWTASLAARAAGTQVRGDIREAALGRLGAIHEDDTIEADPMPALGEGGRPACI
jgi:hypothetical protein